MNANPKLKSEVKMREDLDGYLIYVQGAIFMANHVAHDILLMCDGTKSTDAIADEICKKYAVDRKIAETDIKNYLDTYKSLLV